MRGLKVPDSDEDIFRMTIQLLNYESWRKSGPALQRTEINFRAQNIRSAAVIRLPLFLEG
jgi:hypothetical protein